MSRISSTFLKNHGSRTSNQYLGGPSSKMSVTSPNKIDMNNSLRKSTPNLAANFTATSSKLRKSTPELSNIEAEYIKNLQQQIYFLELESSYLREQARKATDVHPQMTAEAERMLVKLREMQQDMDAMNYEMKRRDSQVQEELTEKDNLKEKLRFEEETRHRDKHILMDEIVQMKKDKERMEQDVTRKDKQLLEVKCEMERSSTALKNAELSIITLKSQLEQRADQHHLTQLSLEEKRSDLLTAERQLKELEDKYYNHEIQMQHKISDDVKEEMKELNQKLKEMEMAVHRERYLRDKMAEDTTSLTKENAMLTQQMHDLDRQIEKEREVRDSNEGRHNRHIAELVTLKDQEKEMKFELDHTRELLKKEHEKSRHTLEMMNAQDMSKSTTDLELTSLRSRMSDMENDCRIRDMDNNQLRKDKLLLVEHVSDIQRKLEDREREASSLRSHFEVVEDKYRETERLKTLETSINSQKWNEFEKLAESMRSLSHTMSVTSAQNPARSSTQLLRY